MDVDGWLLLGVLIVALLYSSVGHGGASGYLAILSFVGVAPKEAATQALLMNVGVAGIAFFAFRRAKHFDKNLAWPFLLGSIPLAFLGGMLKIPGEAHKWLIAAVLLYAAISLLIGFRAGKGEELRSMPIALGVGVGALIGLLSGIVGVGGGIFLSPLLILGRFADAKRTASVSALFILLNSISALAGKQVSLMPVIEQNWPMLIAAVLGALGGSALGANRIPNPLLRQVLGATLLIAVAKLAL